LSDRAGVVELRAESTAAEFADFGDCPELFQIRGHLSTLLVLRLIEPRDDRFFLLLQKAIARSPGFFRHAPIVLDLAPVVGQPPFNLAEFGRRLRQMQLVPVGVQNGDEAWMAVNAGFGLFPAGRPTELATQTQEPGARPAENEAPRRNRTIVVSEPVRAGQQIYAEGGDLIALAPVSPGAEVLADGHVHIYSSLRGRAHAGVGGDEGAQIFCHDLKAQLVSIAGRYVVNEEIETRFIGRRVQIRCLDDAIVMEPLP
jgi:septum site-determining protein MinC